MTPSSNGTPGPDGILQPQRTSSRRWLYVGQGLLLLIVVVYSAAFLIAARVGRQVVASVDEIKASNIEKLSVLAINRPDGGPDITAGGKEMLVIPAEFHETLLAPLRNATKIEKSRGIYVGQINIVFRDGRKVIIYLHRAGDKTLQFKIGNDQYEVVPLDKFLKPLIEVEAKIKSR